MNYEELYGSASTKPIVLVVEDNSTDLSMILEILNIKNCPYIIAKNGQEALELAVSQKPDLILMDIKMLGMDGWEATQRLRNIPAINDVPIIAVTALTGKEAEEQSHTAGCTAHLSKPFAITQLFELLERYLK